jgi:hypothetical protein
LSHGGTVSGWAQADETDTLLIGGNWKLVETVETGDTLRGNWKKLEETGDTLRKVGIHKFLDQNVPRSGLYFWTESESELAAGTTVQA